MRVYAKITNRKNIMEYCTTLITDTAHYTTVQNLRVSCGVKTLFPFCPHT